MNNIMSPEFYEGSNEDFLAELAASRGASGRVKVRGDVPVKNDGEDNVSLDSETTADGQLTIDVFQDEDYIYIQSAIAGITPDDLDVMITKESVSVRGRRERIQRVDDGDYFYQECFWGGFSRSVVLPQEIDPDAATASFKNGILTIKMPKLSRKKMKNLKVKMDD